MPCLRRDLRRGLDEDERRKSRIQEYENATQMVVQVWKRRFRGMQPYRCSCNLDRELAVSAECSRGLD